jgi:hypothetical protein
MTIEDFEAGLRQSGLSARMRLQVELQVEKGSAMYSVVVEITDDQQGGCIS